MIFNKIWKNNWIKRLRMIKTKGKNPSFSAAEYDMSFLWYFSREKRSNSIYLSLMKGEGFFSVWGFHSWWVFVSLFWLKMKKKKENSKKKKKKDMRPMAPTIKYIHEQHTLIQLVRFNFALMFMKFKWQDSLPHSTEQK